MHRCARYTMVKKKGWIWMLIWLVFLFLFFACFSITIKWCYCKAGVFKLESGYPHMKMIKFVGLTSKRLNTGLKFWKQQPTHCLTLKITQLLKCLLFPSSQWLKVSVNPSSHNISTPYHKHANISAFNSHKPQCF